MRQRRLAERTKSRIELYGMEGWGPSVLAVNPDFRITHRSGPVQLRAGEPNENNTQVKFISIVMFSTKHCLQTFVYRTNKSKPN